MIASSDRGAAMFRGMVVVSPETDGYGFVEPDCGGGQVLFRSSSVRSGIRLQVGEAVRYALANGSFALEAVALTRADAGGKPGQAATGSALVGS